MQELMGLVVLLFSYIVQTTIDNQLYTNTS